MKSKIFLIITVVIFLVACSTKKNTRITRTYHNVTSKYNVYFNGNESFKEGLLYLEENHEDNYSEMLNVFLYDDKSVSSISSQMIRAEKKASKLIKKHSITAKPKRKKGKLSDKEKAFYARTEFNNWVDDAYLLMGKSFVMRREFINAKENLNWILTEYPESESKYDALIWLAKTHIQKKDFPKALDILQRAEAEKDFPAKRLNRELFPTYADYYLKQKRYEEAIPWLEKSIETKGKRLYKRRYKFIIAQIYQKLGEDKKAYNMYKQVVKMHPEYKMEFATKIQLATLFDSKTGDSKDIRKSLRKMLKDDKNIDFQDQIYYALAEIDIKEEKEEAAVENYKLAANTSVSNNHQKGLAYLALADIYFEKLNYPIAKAYFDSTQMNISQTHERYSEISDMSVKLTELVNYSETIQMQDSLLTLANMPASKRDAIINSLIQKVIQEEKEKAEEERQRRFDLAQYNENNRPGMNRGGSGGGSQWYFYNPAAIGMGQADFVRKWGERNLEDNWRRKNKTVNQLEFNEDGEPIAQGKDGTTVTQVDLKSKSYYISLLPMTDSAKVVSNQMIEESLYKLARIYRSQFIDYQKSIETFLKLLERYPNTEYKLDTYYQLYQLYKLQKLTEKSDFYKQLILNKYPDSTPAKILTDPNYLAKMEAEKNKTTTIYKKAFEAFNNRKFSKVVEYCSYVEETNPETSLMPKFDLLKAQSVGATGNVDQMKLLLTDVKTSYPSTEESELADFMLSRIETGGFKNFIADNNQRITVTPRKGSSSSTSSNRTSTESSSSTNEELEEIVQGSLYAYNASSPHFYVMAATGKISDLNRLKFNIIKYNTDKFLMFDFSVSDRKLTNDTKLIIVKPLNDAKEAYKYLKLIRRNSKEVYSEFQSLEMKQFIISQENLKILEEDQNLDRYIMFLEQNYRK